MQVKTRITDLHIHEHITFNKWNIHPIVLKERIHGCLPIKNTYCSINKQHVEGVQK